MEQKLVVGADFGNSKIAVAAALKKDDGTLELVDFKHINSNENLIKDGKIVDANALAIVVAEQIKEIESNNNFKIGALHFASAPHTLRSEIRKIGIEHSSSQIDDIERLNDEAEFAEITDTRCVFGVAPLETMFGSRAEGNFLIASSQDAVKEQVINLKNAFGEYKSKDFIAPIVQADNFLSSEQKKNGALLVDLGAGCTSFAVYQGGFPRVCAVVPLGSSHITKDISKKFDIDMVNAEKLKIKIGQGDKFTAKIKDTPVKDNEIAEIILCRLTEIFNFIFAEIENNKIENIKEIVLTGGGANLKFLPEFLNNLYNIKTKIADFQVVDNTKPQEFAKPENALLWALLKNCNDDCRKTELKPEPKFLTDEEKRKLEKEEEKRKKTEESERMRQEKAREKAEKKNHGVGTLFKDFFDNLKKENPIDSQSGIFNE